MSEHSRRNFLKTASIGAAAVGTAAVVPSFTDSADAHPLDSGAAHSGPFTVWVKNVESGEIAVLVGESEVVYKDRTLAKRLARIAAQAKS
jgi:hypothetical protein